MTLVVDNKEKNDVITSGADSMQHLVFEGTDYSYDVRIECDDGCVYKAERKSYSDFVQSWKAGKLSRQIENVDLLIVEKDDTYWDYVAFADKESHRYLMYRNAKKHLASISSNMWVIETDSPQDTVDILRYIERRGRELNVRPNRVKYDGPTTRHALLSALPNINPSREVAEGRTVGDELEERIDWEALVEALNLNSWMDVKYLGIGRIRDIVEALRDENDE